MTIRRMAWLCLALAAFTARAGSSQPVELKASIEYATTADQYLMVYSSNELSSGPNVHGRPLKSDGSPLAKDFRLSTQTGEMSKPDLAYGSKRDRFLVVWEDQRLLATKDDICAQLISPDGALLAASVLVSGTPDIERRPVVAANTRDGTYFVAWESQDAAGMRMFGQKLDSTGHPLAAPVPVGADLGGTRNRAAVSYLKLQNVFLVVFDNPGFNDQSDGIYGQFIESNGALRQSAFPLTTATKGQYRPDITAARNSFFVVWTDYRDAGSTGTNHNVHEYYGRTIGNDMVLSARWRNPQSQ